MSTARTSHSVPIVAAGHAFTAGTLSHLPRLPALWLRRLRSRQELSSLTPEQMRDTGLDPAVVRREARKPFWRA